jgi:hypothetical protein
MCKRGLGLQQEGGCSNEQASVITIPHPNVANVTRDLQADGALNVYLLKQPIRYLQLLTLVLAAMLNSVGKITTGEPNL